MNVLLGYKEGFVNEWQNLQTEACVQHRIYFYANSRLEENCRIYQFWPKPSLLSVDYA